jgi:hypothetical protein
MIWRSSTNFSRQLKPERNKYGQGILPWKLDWESMTTMVLVLYVIRYQQIA